MFIIARQVLGSSDLSYAPSIPLCVLCLSPDIGARTDAAVGRLKLEAVGRLKLEPFSLSTPLRQFGAGKIRETQLVHIVEQSRRFGFLRGSTLVSLMHIHRCCQSLTLSTVSVVTTLGSSDRWAALDPDTVASPLPNHHAAPLQEEKMGKQEVTEIEKDMTLGPMDAFKKKMGW